MLVVRGRKATDPPPPFHGVQGLVAPDQEAVEGHREGAWVETPKSPSGKWLWREKSTEALLAFLGSTRVGCISTRRKPPEERNEGWHEEAGAGDEGGEGGPGPLDV